LTFIKIGLSGDEEFADGLNQLPGELEKAAEGAGAEAGETVLQTVGVQTYPPATAANAPPTPYYKRGVGMQYKARIAEGHAEKIATFWFKYLDVNEQEALKAELTQDDHSVMVEVMGAIDALRELA